MDVGPGWPTLSGPHGAPLLTSSGVELTREVDEIQDFLDRCQAVRYWEREARVTLT